MTTILTFVFGLIILILFVLYYYIRRVVLKSAIISLKDNGALTKKQEETIISQKIRQKEISYYAYLVSLSISFVIGCFAIVKIINSEIDWKLLAKAIEIAGGTLATVSFKMLYNKCVEDLKHL